MALVPTLLLLLLAVPASAAAADLVHHDLKVTVSPERHALSAADRVTLPPDFPLEGKATVRFTLHAGLSPSSSTPGVGLRKEKGPEGDPPVETYVLSLPSGERTFLLEYGGTIDHPLAQVGEESARGQKDTPGSIGPQGIYLSGRSGWYPRFEGEGLLSFRLAVDLPPGWDAVSQGGRDLHRSEPEGVHVAWVSPEPQQEIYLLGGRYGESMKDAGRAKAMVFLRESDEALARRYLDATARHVAFYEKLIGPYPYPKIALVENFWETGYGMPSLTLLGSIVLRLPFIVDTSYPHEILHNWWGNGVYVDYERGNWSEGLTAYLADHLLKEQQGAGAEYRQTTLQKYADYVLSERDLPLEAFRSRHGSVTEAVGYGKCLMLFHMLRLSLGDETFTEGLRTFYRDHRFRAARFADVRSSFEKAAGRDLREEFEPWVTRTGAPRLRVRSARVIREGPAFRLRAVLEQAQEEPFPIRVPVAVTLEGREQAFQATVVMREREAEADLLLPARPVRLDVDPEFDLFRRLDRGEIPPALTQAFGARRALILVPAGADKERREAYRKLAEVLRRAGPGEVEIGEDSRYPELPQDRSVWLLGWENRFMDKAGAALASYGVQRRRDAVRLEGNEIRREGRSFVFAVRHPENPDLALVWVAGDDPAAFPGLGRKLPHYHKYSYLAFEGEEPENRIKGRWPVTDSPMTVFLPREDGTVGRVDMGKLGARKPLGELSPAFSRERMMETVRFLAGPEMKGRGFGTPELDRAAEYIARELAQAGLQPGGDPKGSWFQDFPERGGDPERVSVLRNVIGILPGTRKERAGESVVVGAHYDHLGTGWPSGLEENRGQIHPGADDNASGVAVLLELARQLGRSPAPDRTVVFVAFSGEECGKRGSRHYVAHAKDHPAAKVIGMINLDTVGRLEKKKLLILSGDSAREWGPVFRGAGAAAGVETEIVAQELDASDQTSFLREGAPAVQLFAGPHADYHRPTDTLGKIDGDGLVKVAAVAGEAVEYLARREGPLTGTLRSSPGSSSTDSAPSSGRKVSLGAIPDFACRRAGVCLSGVMAGSPAEKAGLREGDAIVRVHGAPVENLKDLSRVLGSLAAGQAVSVVFVRDGKERAVDVVLEPR